MEEEEALPSVLSPRRKSTRLFPTGFCNNTSLILLNLKLHVLKMNRRDEGRVRDRVKMSPAFSDLSKFSERESFRWRKLSLYILIGSKTVAGSLGSTCVKPLVFEMKMDGVRTLCFKHVTHASLRHYYQHLSVSFIILSLIIMIWTFASYSLRQ